MELDQDIPIPEPPAQLSFNAVTLHLDKIVPADPERGFVPYYHYRITVGPTTVGHINLRIGNTDHIRLYSGHLGYQIDRPHRGHRYALLAGLAIAPLARLISPEQILTCDPTNHPSRRTIELLGATFIGAVKVPRHDPNYLRGSRTKQRFLWLP
jgi:predicted acetyltransferase